MSLALLALSALARPAAGIWIPLPDGAAVCVSAVPESTALKRADRDALASLVARFAAGEPADALVQPLTALRGDSADPAYSSLAVGVALALGAPDAPAAVALSDASPTDPCLAAAAVSALIARDGRDADPDVVTRYVGRAWLKMPHPELARLYAGALLAEGETVRAAAILDPWLAKAPDYPGLKALRAEVSLQSGDTAAGLDALFALHRAGDHARDAVLAPALYKAGRLGDYLQVMHGRGAPLAGAPVVGAADPVAALRAHLGLTAPEQTLMAQIETSKGLLTCTLMLDTAPVTVANFWGLATGNQPWTNPTTGAPGSGPLYEGTKFHRVIPGFMVQGGDPLGTGEGGPGYAFADEVTAAVRFDRSGRLAMANSGPATNGSQFFVTVDQTPHLNGKHTIFGQCDTADVLARMVAAPIGAGDQPVEPITLDRITFEVR